jgi:hypothetical protein
MNEFKDTFELVKKREKELKNEGAIELWTEIMARLGEINGDTDVTIDMVKRILENEVEKWILNSKQ